EPAAHEPGTGLPDEAVIVSEVAAEELLPTGERAEDQGATATLTVPPAALDDGTQGDIEPVLDEPLRRRERRGAGTNALGLIIERQFANLTSPCHSYSDLERHSGISREALSRYVTARVDRRRSPTIDTLVAISDALHIGLEAVARAAAASVKGVFPPPEPIQHAREEALSTLVAALNDDQFNAVVELLRQMRPSSG
ncbi:MAG: helix-turn-helix domain-containing protein, partial [Ktedonobacterales bacterium]